MSVNIAIFMSLYSIRANDERSKSDNFMRGGVHSVDILKKSHV